jgi:pimeloyl-ACP methyl ester carboxylesterase
MKSYRSSLNLRQGCFFLGLLLLTFVLSGCAVPIGVTKVSPQDSYNIRNDNALGAGKTSDTIKAVLQRYNLLELLDKDPLKTLQALHEISKTDDRRDILFALAELSYLHGGKLQAGSTHEGRNEARELFLQSAVYAYFYLLGDGREPPPTAYDSHFRDACDLYNRALWQAFPVNENNSLNFSGGIRNLPVGDLPLTLKTDTLAWEYENFEGLFPADSYAIHGFTVRNRTPGMGLPLVGLTRKSTKSPYGGAMPITAFLKVSGNIRDYQQGHSQAFLELYSALDNAEVRVNDRLVPLETDLTAPLAYRLNDAALWTLGERRFISGGDIPVHVLLIQPYEPGRIPVVFVHGTASSPVWWAEMINSLRSDPELRKRFQFWFYQYNSNNMVALSAAGMREAITAMINKLDPEGEDPALQDMVVIGHSQGGLLTKMAAVNPGNELWNAISDENIDEMDIDPKIRDFARRLLIFQPLPYVKRVVFISTPHRGSYLTKNWVRELVSFVVTLPYDIVVNSKDFLSTMVTRLKLPASMAGKIPTSVDGMSEDNPLLKKMATLPLAPGVVGHSIIAVKPGMNIATGNDGVVEYKSAHIDGVESEFIVRADHSCQSHPFAIEEVRRILLKHVGIDHAWQAPAEPVPLTSSQLTSQ